MKERIKSLDYLRGLAAFGIMIYHYIWWSFGDLDASTTLGRVGKYGVSVFYILSGITLHYVYYDKFQFTIKYILKFFKKRILRIYPLLILVTLIYVSFNISNIDFLKLFLNFTGLFGFFSWDSYYATGVWSIGNELVFYLFFPFFMFFSKKNKLLFGGITLFFLCLYLYFPFFEMKENLGVKENWRLYTNPLNQAFLFLSGFILSLYFERKNISNTILLIVLILSSLLFMFVKAHGDTMLIVMGDKRVLFTILSVLICFSFFKMRMELGLFGVVLLFLGEISYSVYLLHPIVYKVVAIIPIVKDLDILYVLMISILFTIISSYLVYEYYEKFFMKEKWKKLLGSEKK